MEFLAYFNSVISNNIFLAIILSFFAGLVASFSPCTLSSIPLLIGYVQGSEVKDNKKAFKYSLIFSIGLGITFTVIGLLTALIGKAFFRCREVLVYNIGFYYDRIRATSS